MKKEWGKRHTCDQCNTAFFDLCRSEIMCPKCQTKAINKVLTAKELLNLNNEIPDSEEDFQRMKYSNIDTIVKELTNLDSKNYISRIDMQDNFEEELPINQDSSKPS